MKVMFVCWVLALALILGMLHWVAWTLDPEVIPLAQRIFLRAFLTVVTVGVGAGVTMVGKDRW